MRHGRQSPARRFTGYKLHAAAGSAAPILTAISLSAGNEHDGQQAGALVDQQPEQRRPQRVLGDTAYGNVEVREQLEQRSISVLAPLHSTSPNDGTIAKEEFAIDLAAETVTCPRGKTAPIYKSRPRRPNAKLRPSRPRAAADRVARFSRSDCEPCPLRARCAPGGGREIRISRREDLRQAALQAFSDPAKRDHLKRTRPRIERLLGLVVYRYRGRKSRYLGKRKSTLQAVWTARPRQPPPDWGSSRGPGGVRIRRQMRTRACRRETRARQNRNRLRLLQRSPQIATLSSGDASVRRGWTASATPGTCSPELGLCC